jgi:hypothetical protein
MVPNIGTLTFDLPKDFFCPINGTVFVLMPGGQHMSAQAEQPWKG